MERGLTTVIIPTRNRADLLREAIASVEAQTAPWVELIIVDDGSTDETPQMLASLKSWDTFSRGEVQVIRLALDGVAQGPSAARNAGIDAARGEFVMFLDDDDTIEPTKIEEQLEAFTEDVDWVLCDVRIEDAIRGRVELASERYRYPQRDLGGWIRPQLAISNFIPIMSPLIRRSVLGDDLRFGVLDHEDWHFLYAVAARGRVRYLPRVLATYRKQRIGRNSTYAHSPHLAPVDPDGPLLLNLGCGTPGTGSWHPQPGCVNLDRALGWCFEDGLGQYADGSVSGITISHALMYVDDRDWDRVFSEFARVLRPGGVIRITEDDTDHPLSARLGGWRGSEPAVCMTSPVKVFAALERAGLCAECMTELESRYPDQALCQAQHGEPPDVFFIEGVKP